MALRFEVAGHVAWVTLDRPEVLHAVDPETHQALLHAWKSVRDDPNVRVAVLTGTGTRAFCAGIDLNRMGDFYRELPPEERLAVWHREPGVGR